MRHPLDLEALHILFRHRIAPVAALIHIGLSGALIDQRCRHGTPWQRLLPGILLLSREKPTREQWLQAALLYVGTQAMVTGFDALYLHGLKSTPVPPSVHVLTPRHSRAVSYGPLNLMRTAHIPKPVLRHGFHTAPLARATIDAIRCTKSIADTRAILEEATYLVGLDALRAELAMAPHKGTALARKLLGDSPTRQLEHAVMTRRPTTPGTGPFALPPRRPTLAAPHRATAPTLPTARRSTAPALDSADRPATRALPATHAPAAPATDSTHRPAAPPPPTPHRSAAPALSPVDRSAAPALPAARCSATPVLGGTDGSVAPPLSATHRCTAPALPATHRPTMSVPDSSHRSAAQALADAPRRLDDPSTCAAACPPDSRTPIAAR